MCVYIYICMYISHMCVYIYMYVSSMVLSKIVLYLLQDGGKIVQGSHKPI